MKKTIKRSKIKKVIRKNPYVLNEMNLRRWAFLNLLRYKPTNDTSFGDAATEAADQLLIKYYDKNWIIEHLTVIFKYWRIEWAKFIKDSNIKNTKEKENLWRDFIFSINMPNIVQTSPGIHYDIRDFWMRVNIYNEYPYYQTGYHQA